MIREHAGGNQTGRRYARYLAHYSRKNRSLLVLGGLFIAGVLLGACLIRSVQEDTLLLLDRLTGHFLAQRGTQNLGQVFASCAKSSLLYIAVLFAAGFCAIAQPVAAAAPLLRGLGFGFSVAGLYAHYGLRATGYVALFLVPDMLLTVLAILFCCRESLRLSRSFLQAAFVKNRGGRDGGGEFYSLRIYVARYLAAACLCLLSAFVQSAIFTAFANYVVLG